MIQNKKNRKNNSIIIMINKKMMYFKSRNNINYKNNKDIHN